jgi:uncharacterized membrane protein
MTSDWLLTVVVAAGVIISVPFAVRATWRLWRLWRHDEGRSLLLLAFWVVALIVTTAGIWIGFLSVRRLIGFEALDWSPFITGVLVVLVLQIPMILDGLVQRVAHRPNESDNIGRGPA